MNRQHVGVVAAGSEIPPHLAAVWRQADELRSLGDVPGAIAVLEPAAEVASLAYGEDSPEAIVTLHRLAVLYRLRGDLAAARRVLDEAQAGGERRFGDDDPLMLAVAGELGAVAEELGNRHEARRNWGKVAQYGPDRLGPEHPQVRAALAYLNEDPGGPVYVPPARPVIDEPTLTYLPASGPPPGPPSAPRPPAPPLLPAQRPAPSGYPPVSAPPTSGPPVSAPPLSPPPLSPPPLSPPPMVGARVPSGQPSGAHPPLFTPQQPVEQGVWRVAAPPQPGMPAAGFPSVSAIPASAPPDTDRGGRLRTVLLAVGLALVVLAAVAVGSLWQRRSDNGAAPGPAGSTSPSHSVAASTDPIGPPRRPPGAVKLRDNGDHATVTWTDPTGGTVPFIINGGYPGQQSHTYATVPAGTTSYTVNALNVNFDYCFVVIAVYTVDDLVTSDLVCTRRHLSPTPGG